MVQISIEVRHILKKRQEARLWRKANEISAADYYYTGNECKSA